MKAVIKGVVSIAFLSLLASCSSKEEKAATTEKPPLGVKAFVVVGESFANDLSATAELLSSEQVELKAPLSATVLEIFFKEGQQITEGQSIIKLDDRAWKAQLSGLKSQLVNAEKDLSRKKQLLAIQGSSQEEIDAVSTAVEILKSQIAQLQINIGLANVKAPFSGQLGMRDFSLGAFLKEGDAITTLSATNTLKVNFEIPQEYLTSISLGKSIKVIVNKDTLKAVVYAINPVINVASRTINVRARLNQPSKKKILPGTFAEVVLSTNYIKDALLVPTQSIVPEINNQTVYVLKNGIATRTTVQLGARTAEKVHVLSGVAMGDTIITTGLMQVKDGAKVKLQNLK